MEKLALEQLKGNERRKVKKQIQDFKKDKRNFQMVLQNKEKLQEYEIRLDENKILKEQCLLENEKRKITEKEYERRMHLYDLESYELELEMLFLQREIFSLSSILKRLNCLSLLLGFYDGVEVMVLQDSNGKKKSLHIDEVYQLFIHLVLNDAKTSLEMNQKIAQAYMLINKKQYSIGEKHKFYLTEEKQKEVYASILEDRERVKEIEQHSKMDSFPLENMTIEDFFHPDIVLVYERLFASDLKRTL